MAATATIRQLRNQFPEVRKLLEEEGEVIVTDQGAPRYRLTRYAPDNAAAVPAKDYLTRLRRHQPHPLSSTAAKKLRDANRGDR